MTNVNDQPTGDVTISGTVTEGETLTAQTGTLADNDGLGAFSYQWQRGDDQGGFANIANATARTYTLGDDDAGRTLRVQVRYTDGNGTAESLTSDATAAVTNVNDQPTGDVTISGTVTEGETLTAQTGTLADNDGLGAFSYQWQRSDGAAEFTDIENATSETYTLGDDDVNFAVRVQVSYTDGNNTAETVTSDETTAVGNANGGSVVIEVDHSVSSDLKANVSEVRNAGNQILAIQWQRQSDDGIWERLNDTSEYRLTEADLGARVRVAVTYANAEGTVQSAFATTEVVGGFLAGRDGDDTLVGLGGNDSLYGRAGDDTLTGGAGADRLLGGDGTDTASYASSPAAVRVILEDGSGEDSHAQGDTLINIENLIGSGAGDELWGDFNANRLEGGEGDDILNGLFGNDTLIGGAGNDTFSGGMGNDTLIGDDGNDNLRAGAGDDRLYGGAGNDNLFGGPAADRFLFASEAEGDDRIEDFDTNDDRLVFDADEWTGDNDNERLADLINATRLDADDNIVIDRPDNRGSITLEGVGADIALEGSVSFIFDPDITI